VARAKNQSQKKTSSRKGIRSLAIQGALVVGEQRGPRVTKPIETIAIRPTRGKLSALDRRVFNVFLYLAEKQERDVKPIRTADGTLVSPLAKYRAGLNEVMRNASPNSNDFDSLRSSARGLHDTDVEWYREGNDERVWGISSLLSSVEIIQRKGGSIVEWSFSPTLKERLMGAPGQFARIPLQTLIDLRSHAAIALYEICFRYATSPNGLTMRKAWKWWVPVLTGTPESGGLGTYSQYKYFKRDVVARAIGELNRLSDVFVELLEHYQGRSVGELQFKVTQRSQQRLDLGAMPLIDESLVARMTALGVIPQEARGLYTEHDEGTIRAALEHVEKRVKSRNAKPIDNPAAYFRDALAKGYAKPPQLPAKPEPMKAGAQGPSKEKVLELLRQARRDEARILWRELGDEERQSTEAAFASTGLKGKPVLQGPYKKHGLKSKLVQVEFLEWYGTKLWGEPTDAELLDFALRNRDLLR
jgi:hypothetical protein